MVGAGGSSLLHLQWVARWRAVNGAPSVCMDALLLTRTVLLVSLLAAFGRGWRGELPSALTQHLTPWVARWRTECLHECFVVDHGSFAGEPVGSNLCVGGEGKYPLALTHQSTPRVARWRAMNGVSAGMLFC